MTSGFSFTAWRASYAFDGGIGVANVYTANPIPWPVSKEDWDLIDNAVAAIVEPDVGKRNIRRVIAITPMADEEEKTDG